MSYLPAHGWVIGIVKMREGIGKTVGILNHTNAYPDIGVCG